MFRLLSLTLISLIMISNSLAQNTPSSQHKKVIIIGAGVSGLSAAKYLQERDIEVIVLEAQDIIGGRLKTDRSIGIPFDEGASWIHGPRRNPITKIARKSGINTISRSKSKYL